MTTAETHDKDPAAQAMVQKRWAKTTPAQRSAIAKEMAQSRWGTGKAAKKAPAKKTAKKK